MNTVSYDTMNNTRKKLMAALGEEKRQKYFHQMKQWFRMKCTKEDFDDFARSMLSPECVHLHNEFFLAILSKCQLFNAPATTNNSSSSSVSYGQIKSECNDFIIEKNSPTFTQTVQFNHNSTGNPSIHMNSGTNVNERKKMKPKRKTKSVNVIGNNFEQVKLQDIAPTANLREPNSLNDANAGYYARSLQLLDTGPLRGRVLLCAWDHGLSTFNEQVAVVLQEAAKNLLKTILAGVISKRKGYRIREGKFKYSVGTVPVNPWLRNAVSLNDWNSESAGLPLGEHDLGQRPTWPTVDAAEQNAVHLASCAPTFDDLLMPVSAFDLFEALSEEKSLIPVHSVYAVAMERISCRLWHPSALEINKEVL